MNQLQIAALLFVSAHPGSLLIEGEVKRVTPME